MLMRTRRIVLSPLPESARGDAALLSLIEVNHPGACPRPLGSDATEAGVRTHDLVQVIKESLLDQLARKLLVADDALDNTCRTGSILLELKRVRVGFLHDVALGRNPGKPKPREGVVHPVRGTLQEPLGFGQILSVERGEL